METNNLFSEPVFVAVLGSTTALLAVFLIANGIAAWYDERAKRAVAVVRKGGQLPAGFGTFHGVAQNFDARSGGELVRCERTQMGAQVASGIVWKDRGSTVTARPFLLVLDDGGGEIEIDAREPRLLGFPETSSGAYINAPREPVRREIISRVSAGDEVWATGVLVRAADKNAGAYRSSVARRKLRAPRRGALEISRESPVARWAWLATAHKRGAYVSIGMIALLHGMFFRAVDAQLFQGPASFSWAAMIVLRQRTAIVVIPAAVGILFAACVWLFGVRRAAAKQRD